MLQRPSSRILVIDQDHRILLFRFVHTSGALAGKDWWGTPGGALEKDETFVQAAQRELFEETGIIATFDRMHIAEQDFVLHLPDGEPVHARERFFVARVADQSLSTLNWTDAEREVMKDCKWWSREELLMTREIVFPENILEILNANGL